MAVCRVNGARLYFQTAGDGPPLLLVHGLGSTHLDWEYQIPEFSNYFRVVAPDLRGYGASDRAGEYSVRQFSADLWALIDHLGLPKVALAGYSMGGAVAMQMALDQPDRVSRLVLSNTLPSFQPDTATKRWILWTRLLLMSAFGPVPLSRFVARRLFPRPDQATLRERVAVRNAENSRWVYLSTIRELTRWSVRDRVPSLKMPVLVLAAEHDYFEAQDTDAFVAMLPNGRLVRFAGTRHGLPMELPEQYNRVVLDFLRAGAA